MKAILPFLLLVPSPLVLAEACPATEYAELKDMRQDELEARYCHLKHYQATKAEQANELARSGQLVSLQYMKYSFQCEEEAKRVAGILERTHDAAPPDCAADAAPDTTQGATQD